MHQLTEFLTLVHRYRTTDNVVTRAVAQVDIETLATTVTSPRLLRAINKFFSDIGAYSTTQAKS